MRPDRNCTGQAPRRSLRTTAEPPCQSNLPIPSCCASRPSMDWAWPRRHSRAQTGPQSTRRRWSTRSGAATPAAARRSTTATSGGCSPWPSASRAGRGGGGGAGGVHPHLPRPGEVPRRRGAGDLDLPAGGQRRAVAPVAPRRRVGRGATAATRTSPATRTQRRRRAGARRRGAARAPGDARWRSCRPGTEP